jgi:hypothetical protein
MKIFGLGIVMVLLAAFFLYSVPYRNIKLEQECTGYLKRAADANTIELAASQLQKSTRYLEDNGITQGYTSILWRTPDEDIQFWYENLKDCERQLMNVTDTTSSLEKR